VIARTPILLALAVPFLLATAPEETGEVADDFICGMPWIVERTASTEPTPLLSLFIRDHEGPRSTLPIQRAFDEDALKGCLGTWFDEHEDPDIEGELRIRFTVTPEGLVTERELLETSTLEVVEIQECVLASLREADFPATDDEEPTRFVLHLQYRILMPRKPVQRSPRRGPQDRL